MHPTFPPNALNRSLRRLFRARHQHLYLQCTTVSLYNLHLRDGRKEEVVNAIQILVAEEADLDLALSFATKLDDSDLGSKCSPQLRFGRANVWVDRTRRLRRRRPVYSFADEMLRSTNGEPAINHLSRQLTLLIHLRE